MKIHRWSINAGAALALFLATGADAQGQEQVASGEAAQEKQPAQPSTLVLPARVRLTMTDGSRLKAELVRVEEGRFIVRTMARIPEERSIASTEVKRAEISHGTHGRARGGFLLGGLIGFSIGALYAGCCEDDGSDPTTTERLGAGAFSGLIVGGVGAGIGALIRTERWSDISVSSLTATSPPVKADNEPAEVSPDRQMRFAIGPTVDRGVQARFSISWR